MRIRSVLLVLAVLSVGCITADPKDGRCGKQVGDACCFAAPTTYFCDNGLSCTAERKCADVPDLGGTSDLFNGDGPCVPFGAECVNDGDCCPGKSMQNGTSIHCFESSPFPDHVNRCCFNSRCDEH